MDDHVTSAWGTTLMPHKRIVDVDTHQVRTLPPTIPKTLAEALNLDTTPTTKISVEKDEIRNDLLRLRDQANQSYMILAQFTEHNNLGLSLNKIAGLIDKTTELLKKYE